MTNSGAQSALPALSPTRSQRRQAPLNPTVYRLTNGRFEHFIRRLACKWAHAATCNFEDAPTSHLRRKLSPRNL